MARERSRLVWGSLLLVIGVAWLSTQLHVASFFARLGLALLFAGTFGGMAAALLVAHRVDPRGRSALLVPTALSAALAVIVPGAVFHLFRGELAVAILFGSLAVAFFAMSRHRTRARGRLLCAWIFGVFAVLFGLEALGALGGPGDHVVATFLLAAIGAPFLFAFLRTGRETMLIPAGILFTTALMPLAEALHVPERIAALIFLLGLGGTFASVYLLGRPGRVGWARWAAIACGGIAFFQLFERTASFVLPLGFIAGGLWLILRPRASTPARPPAGDAPPPGPAVPPTLLLG